jgi:hypothetical protein
MNKGVFVLIGCSEVIIGLLAILGLFTYYRKDLKSIHYPTTAPKNIREMYKGEIK